MHKIKFWYITNILINNKYITITNRKIIYKKNKNNFR